MSDPSGRSAPPTPTLSPPQVVLDIAAQLESAGYEAWCVGGAVRDALLGHPHLDWDLATSATPDEVRELFGRRRTIPVGIEFGTVGVLDPAGTMHEVTTFRRDVRTDGRHAEVEFGASLDDDLARRDFTINAIAYSPKRGELRDPFGGRADLERRLVRAVGDAGARMREDRLRALRAIRFASRFGFAIEPSTFAAIRESAPHLGRLSPERVKQELEKTMEQVERPSAAIRLWKESGAFATLIPSIAALDERTIAALDCLPPPGPSTRPYRRLLRVAALFTELPDADAKRALAALRFSTRDSSQIVALAATWREIGDAIISALRSGDAPDDRTVRQWVARIGRLDVAPFMRFAAALWSGRVMTAGEGTYPARAVHSLYRRMRRSAGRDPIELRDLAVDGEDLVRAGVPRGPAVGRILRALLECVLIEPEHNRTDWLLHEAKRLVSSPAPEAGERARGARSETD